MTDRAASTVLDVALFVLLVGAAVLTLTGAPTPTADPADGRAHEVATVLATSTAQVNDTPGGDASRRSAHGTLAGLLADATTRSASADGAPLARDDAFAAAVKNATRPVLAGEGWRAEVVVAWRPFPGAHLGSELRVGHSPPGTADVHAATTTVGNGLPAVREDACEAARVGGYDAVAATVAGAVVRGLFPPDATRARLDDLETADAARRRYRLAGDAYGISTARPVERGQVDRANGRLRDAMADRLAADLRREFDTPRDAADAVEVGRVRITVRAWSP